MTTVESASATESIRHERFHDLDALRASAMLLGIILHAAWLFVPESTLTPRTDRSATHVLYFVFSAIHTFRMQAFFLIAGFFAHLLIVRRGSLAFVNNRLFRIGIPLCLGWILIAPIALYYYSLGGLQNGRIQSDMDPWELTWLALSNSTPTNFPLLHLWFLYYLLLFYAITVVLLAITRQLDPRRSICQWMTSIGERLLTSRFHIILFALLTLPFLYAERHWLGIVGVATGGLVPKWSGMGVYGIFFAVGWLLYSRPNLLSQVTRSWRLKGAFGLLLTVPLFFWLLHANSNGWNTWLHPRLSSRCIADYDAFRGKLIHSNRSATETQVWEALPPGWQTFLENHETVTEQQMVGLGEILNRVVIANPDFAPAAEVAAADSLTAMAGIPVNVSKTARTPQQTASRNRAHLEAAFPGIIRPDARTLPYYPLVRATFSFAYGLAMWTLVFGTLGLFRTYISGPSPNWRYWSDASYWMYLLHIPVLFQIQVWINDYAWPWPLKFAIYVFGAVAVLWPTYHFAVRPTVIGWVLNGRRYPLVEPRLDDSKENCSPSVVQPS